MTLELSLIIPRGGIKIYVLGLWNKKFASVVKCTGCRLETDQNYALIAQARKQPINWDRCLFDHYICTF